MVSQGTAKMESSIVWIPEELEIALNLKQQFGADAEFVAGGTLLQTNWEKDQPIPLYLISLERITALQGFKKETSEGGPMIQIGALTTLAEIIQNPFFLSNLPLLAEAAKSIAAPAVRNRGTIGGNIAGGTGDTIPAFLVMDAHISFVNGTEIQQKPLEDCLKEGILQDGSILVSIDLFETGGQKFFKKVGRREAFTPSVVTIAGSCRVNSNKEMEAIRLAVGGGSNQPCRLEACEKLLHGNILSKELLEKLFLSIMEEFAASSDDFYTADYKKTIAANVIVYEMARFAGQMG